MPDSRSENPQLYQIGEPDPIIIPRHRIKESVSLMKEGSNIQNRKDGPLISLDNSKVEDAREFLIRIGPNFKFLDPNIKLNDILRDFEVTLNFSFELLKIKHFFGNENIEEAPNQPPNTNNAEISQQKLNYFLSIAQQLTSVNSHLKKVSNFIINKTMEFSRETGIFGRDDARERLFKEVLGFLNIRDPIGDCITNTFSQVPERQKEVNHGFDNGLEVFTRNARQMANQFGLPDGVKVITPGTRQMS